MMTEELKKIHIGIIAAAESFCLGGLGDVATAGEGRGGSTLLALGTWSSMDSFRDMIFYFQEG
jgi:hypothetical protein